MLLRAIASSPSNHAYPSQAFFSRSTLVARPDDGSFETSPIDFDIAQPLRVCLTLAIPLRAKSLARGFGNFNSKPQLTYRRLHVYESRLLEIRRRCMQSRALCQRRPLLRERASFLGGLGHGPWLSAHNHVNQPKRSHGRRALSLARASMSFGSPFNPLPPDGYSGNSLLEVESSTALCSLAHCDLALLPIARAIRYLPPLLLLHLLPGRLDSLFRPFSRHLSSSSTLDFRIHSPSSRAPS